MAPSAVVAALLAMEVAALVMVVAASATVMLQLPLVFVLLQC